MVVFTCNHCGDSVKKPAVEKHYNSKCRNQTVNVSCMDCQKDFLGDAHVAHTKCITEAEKYSGKDYVPKVAKNTNAKKQDSWLEVVRSILRSTDYKMKDTTRAAFQKIQHFQNVPRKKPKFENFALKCMRLQKTVVRDVWTILEKELEKMDAARKQQQEAQKLENNKRKANENGNAEEPATKKKKKQQAENGVADAAEELATKKKKKQQAENGVADAEEPATKNKKKQQAENGVADAAEEPATKKNKKKQGNTDAEQVTEETNVKKQQENTDIETNGTADAEAENFKWLDVLEKLVRKEGDAGIALEKLQAKVLKKYKTKLGLETLTPKQEKKFAKKFTKNLKSCTNIAIDNDVVKVA